MKQILISIVLIITLAIGSLSSCTSKLASCTGGEDPTSSTVTGEISGSESSGKTDPFGKPTDSSGEHYSEAIQPGRILETGIQLETRVLLKTGILLKARIQLQTRVQFCTRIFIRIQFGIFL